MVNVARCDACIARYNYRNYLLYRELPKHHFELAIFFSTVYLTYWYKLVICVCVYIYMLYVSDLRAKTPVRKILKTTEYNIFENVSIFHCISCTDFRKKVINYKIK